MVCNDQTASFSPARSLPLRSTYTYTARFLSLTLKLTAAFPRSLPFPSTSASLALASVLSLTLHAHCLSSSNRYAFRSLSTLAIANPCRAFKRMVAI